MKKLIIIFITVTALAISGCTGGGNTTAAPGDTAPADTSASGQTSPEETAVPVTDAQPAETPESSAQPAETESDTILLPGKEDIGGLSDIPVYSVYVGYEDYEYLNAAGQLLPDSGYEWATLTDMLTGEPVYYTCRRYEKDGVNEYGEPHGVCYSRIYDLSGEMLSDWAPGLYTGGVGTGVIRHPFFDWLEDVPDDFESCLWDPVSDKVILEDAYYLDPVNDRLALCRGTEPSDYIGIVDSSASVVKEVPDWMEAEYLYTMKGYICGMITYEGARVNALMDEELDVLLTEPPTDTYSFDSRTIRGEYMIVQSDYTEFRMLRLPDFECVATYYGGVVYFDGEIAAAGGYQQMYLEGTQGEVIAGPFEQLYALSSQGISEYFLAKDYEGSWLILDRKGGTVRSMNDPEIAGMYTSNGRIVYGVHIPGAEEWELYYGIMDGEFNVLISADMHYNDISALSWEPDVPEDTVVWKCSRSTGWYRSRADLYNASCEMIFSDAAAVGYMIDEYIPVGKGFYYGLIDREGKWAARCSKFSASAYD